MRENILLGLAALAVLVVLGMAVHTDRVNTEAAQPTAEQREQLESGLREGLTLREFDYKGKRCLWATIGHTAGLTCWDVAK